MSLIESLLRIDSDFTHFLSKRLLNKESMWPLSADDVDWEQVVWEGDQEQEKEGKKLYWLHWGRRGRAGGVSGGDNLWPPGEPTL